jgi:hypothetical protein
MNFANLFCSAVLCCAACCMSCNVQGDRWVYKPGSPGWDAAQERLSGLMLKLAPRPEAAVMQQVLGGVVQMHQRMARKSV